MVCFEEVVHRDLHSVKSIIFTVRLGVGCERERAVKENSMCFSSSDGMLASFTATEKTRGGAVQRGRREGNQEFCLTPIRCPSGNVKQHLDMHV